MPIDRVQFVEAGDLDLRGIQLPGRTIVLTESAYARAVRRFGAFYPESVRIMRSLDGTEAFIRFDEHWRGGSMHAALRNGVWTFTLFRTWVT